MLTDRSVLSRRALLSGLAAGIAAPALARAPSTSPFPVARPRVPGASAPPPSPSPPPRPLSGLSDLLARANLSGQTALVALDAQTGEVIEAHNPELALPPASTAKTISALYALAHLSPEHRFVTRVLAQGGAIEGGTLRGDLILKGGGDPVLQTADLARLADALIARGLRRIEGRFLIDQTALPTIPRIDDSQPVQAGYNPSVSGLNLNFNRVHFAWEVSNGRPSVSLDARSEREVPGVSVIEMRAVSRDLPVYTHEVRADRERWTVSARALGQPGSRWLPVRLPGLYAGDVLRALLMARGCRLPEPRIARAGLQGTVLAEHYSDPLQGILRGMLRYSTNLTAEAIGLTASRARGHRVSSLTQSAARMSEWAREALSVEGLDLRDHSGLSDASRVSAQALARFMLGARRDGRLADLLRNYPMRNARGEPIRAHPVAVRAKTGTLNFVSTLTGYAEPRGGRPVVFAILSADLPRRRAAQAADDERPAGARGWNRRARALQQELIERWTLAQG